MRAGMGHRGTVHRHSIDAYYEEEPKLSQRARDVLGWLRRNGPATDRDVMTGLGYTDMNAVRPRITELIDAGKLTECGEKVCDVTGKTVRIVEAAMPRQVSLLEGLM